MKGQIVGGIQFGGMNITLEGKGGKGGAEGGRLLGGYSLVASLSEGKGGEHIIEGDCWGIVWWH